MNFIIKLRIFNKDHYGHIRELIWDYDEIRLLVPTLIFDGQLTSDFIYELNKFRAFLSFIETSKHLDYFRFNQSSE